MRGFVLTLISASMIALLVFFAAMLQESQLSTERAVLRPLPLSYGAYVFDDVFESVKDTVGPELVLEESNSSFTLFVHETLPPPNYTARLAEYESFLEGTIANQSHAQIDANFSNISLGDLKIFINDRYAYQSDLSQASCQFTSPGGTGALAYAINLSNNGVRSNFTVFQFNESGNLNVSIYYADASGYIRQTGKLFSNQNNRMDIYYEDGSHIYLEVGLISGNAGSLKARSYNKTTDLSWSAMLPKTGNSTHVGYAYDATLEYIQNDVRVIRQIGD